MTQPIAIVGMGCRFGGAVDLVAYWRLMLEGRDAFREVPPDRWDHDFFHSTSKRVTDKYYPPRGAFVEDVRTFPALHFGIPPRRVEVMDPQHRIALEVSVQALADAGLRVGEAPQRTGVFLGTTAYEYRALMSSRVIAQMMATGAFGEIPEDATSIAEAVERIVPSRPFTAPGALGNMTAATVAQELDLRGPAYTTDAACASALIAVNDAVAHLRAGTIDGALAGGVYVNVLPEHYIAFSRIGAMSASGYLRPFDHRADGFLQGDGGGVVLLKRLDDALASGDRIYAVIEGAAFNNDGRGDGPMAPLQRGQTDAIVRAWDDSGLDKGAVGYIEAHGTGTAVGDQTEFNGLQAAFGDAPRQPVYLGSSKGNIGHTMSAAGIAGLIRTALAVHHRVIPPMAGFERPKEGLDLDSTSFRVPTAPVAWGSKERVAGVSSFGFGGTNAHLVVRQAPTPAPAQARGAQLVLISGPDEAQLRAHCGALAAAIAADDAATVAGVAATLAVRPALRARATVIAADCGELVERLQELAAGEVPEGCFLTDAAPQDVPRVAFLYPGQGAQRPDMLHDARQRFGVIEETLAELEPAGAGLLATPLRALLYPAERDVPVSADEAAAELTETQNCQPALLAVGVALTRLLAEVGVHPSVVLGHSLGEFTAAAAGGVLAPADALRFVARRGRAMAELPGDHGAMAAIMAPSDAVEPLLADGAVIANVNHPRQVVVSGSSEAVQRTMENAAAAEMRAIPLEVSHAFHSPVLDGLDVGPLLADLHVKEPGEVVVASGISATPYASAADARAVFARHATSPVQFVRALEQCLQAGAELFLQVGAGGPTAAFARGALPRNMRSRVLSLGGIDDRDGGRSLLEGLARLWLAGVPLDLRPIAGPAQLCTLPATPLPRELYWAVKDEAQLPLDLPGVVRREAPSRPAQTKAEASAALATSEGTGDTVFDQVVAVISKVSAYPASAIRSEMTLIGDLGFDSLMVGDLATGLADAFPTLGGIPQELLVNRPTVSVLVEHVRSGGSGVGAEEIDDDAPLLRYRPSWTAAPLPDLPARLVTANSRVLVTRDADGLCDAVAAQLTRKGHRVELVSAKEAVQAGPCELLVHCTAAGITTPYGHVVEGLSDWPDSAGTLLAILANQARQEAHPDVLVAIEEGDVWGEGMTGALLSLDREWPEARVKAVTLAEDVSVDTRAGLLLAEWTSAEATVEVHHADGLRSVRAYTPVSEVDASPPLPIGANDVVLISGGTRGIGARLAERLAPSGATLLLVGRSAPGDLAASLLGDRVHFVQADITDRTALALALADHSHPTVFIHAAGVLADGPLEDVEAGRGLACRRVKVEGWLSGLAVAGGALRIAVGLGSWAGRFGNRHQTHYAAANALLSALAHRAQAQVAVTVAEMGPWTSSEMVSTIPAPIRDAMRAEGVDFVGDEAGLEALLRDLGNEHGPLVHGRRVPSTARRIQYEVTLDVDAHPYLADHAISGVPVLPLASAAELFGRLAGASHGFVLEDLQLFSGITVKQPTRLAVSLSGEQAEIRSGDQRTLCYRATLTPMVEPPTAELLTGGKPVEPGALERFYREVTFHGPMLQGISAVDAEGEDFVRGKVRTGSPRAWILRGPRPASWSIDPLALDSAFQLAGFIAERRYKRGGTPVGIDRWVQVRPWPAGELAAQVRDWNIDGDRFTGTVELFDASGALVALAEGAQADFKRLDEDALVIEPEWIDVSQWQVVKDLDQRLQVAKAVGIDNPYFMVHEGTAKNTTVINGRELVNYSSYNYLGLSGDPRVLDAVDVAVRRYGTSVSASRVASGERPFHHELEALLAKCQGAEDALLFTAGHATNVTTIGHLMGAEDLILHDEFIHDSALQGIKLSGAARRGFKHDDMADLERQLRQLRGNFKKCLIIAEGVYSMDGDLCQLPELVELKKRYGCLLMIDEAHSFGICGATGCGVSEHYGIDGGEIDIWMGTLSKSLASCGGWIAGSAPLIRYLRYTAPGFVYSAGLTPANGVAALESLKWMLAEPERVQTLQGNARFFHDQCVEQGLDTGPALGGSAVIPVITGNSMHALVLSQRLMEQGINVQPIIFPAVADDAARLRFFLSSTHTREQLRWTAATVAETLRGVRAEYKL